MVTGRLRRLAGATVRKAGFALREHAPVPGRRGYRRFCIVTPGRAGSEMLVQRCESHPQIRCYGEVLAPGHISWVHSRRSTTDPAALAARDNDPLRFLERHVWHPYPPRIRAVGLKLVYSHMFENRSAVERLMAQPDLRVIWLERHDQLQMCLSRQIARETNIYSVVGAAEVPDTPPVRVDPALMERSLKLLEVARHEVASIVAGTDCLRLYYEDLVERPEETNRSICAFLGVDDLPLVHSAKKLARGGLRERIANFDELKAHLQGTRWSDCIGED